MLKQEGGAAWKEKHFSEQQDCQWPPHLSLNGKVPFQNQGA